MLKTPTTFTSLISSEQHCEAHNFIFRGDELLISESDFSLPDDVSASKIAGSLDHFHPVGLWMDRYCRTTALPFDVIPNKGFIFKKLRTLLFDETFDKDLVAVAGRAFQIAEWARTNRYCGACAKPMEKVSGERCLRCASCNVMAYPRISPAMMVLVKKGESILLARHVSSPLNIFTALAGFVESGESIEDAIHREVFEEVGLRINNIKYFGSQSWPFPHSLMVAFTAEYVDGEITIDPNEIAEARWFGRQDELPAIAPSVSIAEKLITSHFIASKT